MRGKPVKDPRRIGAHVGVLLDELRELGATDVEVFKTKHLIVVFWAGPYRLEIRTACTPRDPYACVVWQRAAVRKALHDKCIAVGAPG
jgi:hypothetical protein